MNFLTNSQTPSTLKKIETNEANNRQLRVRHHCWHYLIKKQDKYDIQGVSVIEEQAPPTKLSRMGQTIGHDINKDQYLKSRNIEGAKQKAIAQLMRRRIKQEAFLLFKVKNKQINKYENNDLFQLIVCNLAVHM